MTIQEIVKAVDELKDWFKGRGNTPSDATIIAMEFLAHIARNNNIESGMLEMFKNVLEAQDARPTNQTN